ncbi:Hsp20/alpha crystallin family protein [Streptomyces sp. NPDC059862]|uniref:Hsp20/alpha crystallin family protein n=1 Tax=Streptomyces sp. NPDC059862 TaxID=3346975 RepID=UPI00365FE105
MNTNRTPPDYAEALGVDPETIDLDVERNVLTVKTERHPSAGETAEVLIAERPTGSFSRQFFLGETLDTERVDAAYDAGVLRLHVPIAEQAKPRKIAITGGNTPKQIRG